MSILPAMSEYDSWAAVYDAWAAVMPAEDVAHYVSLAQEADGPIVELAVGSGRVAVEDAALLLPAVQMEERAGRDVDQCCRLVELEIAHVAEPQVEPLRDAGLARTLGAHRQHPRRRVHADHVSAGERRRDGDPSGANRELDDFPARGESLVDVEGHVLDDARTPRVVEPRDGVVDAQGFRVT